MFMVTEFKSWLRLFVFHIELIPLGKVWIQLFFLQSWERSCADWVLYVWQLAEEKEKSEFKPVELHLKIDIVLHPAQAEGLVNTSIRNK